MSAIPQHVNTAIQVQQLQSLYSLVHSAVAEPKLTADPSLKAAIGEFEQNMITLIGMVSPHKVHPYQLTKNLVLFVNRLSSEADEAELVKVLCGSQISQEEKLTNTITVLRNLCQNEFIKSILSMLQPRLATACILNAEEPLSLLKQNLQLWQFHLPEKDPKHKLAVQNVIRIKNDISFMQNEIKEIKELCEKFKLSSNKS